MKFKKLGKVFDPSDSFARKNDFVGFAQSPQALVFDDFIRIYFSIRKKSDNGKFLSHIQFIDVTKNLEQIINYSQNEVIKLGMPGTFDEHGIFPFNVVRLDNIIYGYISGWTRRVSVSVDTGIGLSVSHDSGLTFQRIGDGPILSSSLYEPFLVGDPFVQIYDGIFHMWYIFGTEWKQDHNSNAYERVYKIGHCTSLDGINWHKQGKPIIKDNYENECQALPSVIKINDVYHMYFCYRQPFNFRTEKEMGYRIGYAYSRDLLNWVRDDSKSGIAVSDSGWDSEMMCYPHIFKCDKEVYLLYNGNEFGKYGFGVARLENYETPCL